MKKVKQTNLFGPISKIIQIIAHNGIPTIFKNSLNCPLATPSNTTKYEMLYNQKQVSILYFLLLFLIFCGEVAQRGYILHSINLSNIDARRFDPRSLAILVA